MIRTLFRRGRENCLLTPRLPALMCVIHSQLQCNPFGKTQLFMSISQFGYPLWDFTWRLCVQRANHQWTNPPLSAAH